MSAPLTSTAVNEKANLLLRDILVNHLPRVQEGLEKGYIDENQILVMYDHAVRIRILNEMTASTTPRERASLNLDCHAAGKQ